MSLARFQSVGRDLFTRGLVSSHGGNLSIRQGDQLLITRRSSMLGNLEEQDLLEIGIDKNTRVTPLASTELRVHRAIYEKTPAQAVVHAHPPHAIALSLTERHIVPTDMEGRNLLPRVPVLGWNTRVSPGCLAEAIVEALKEHPVVIIRGHGSFATGQLLEEAYHYTTVLEESCRILCLLRSLGVRGAALASPRKGPA
ncbi:MAG TPA: aldolase [Dehalococcoidia bacterium]|nr:aldolase [Dehalococcoidia bacterium]